MLPFIVSCGDKEDDPDPELERYQSLIAPARWVPVMEDLDFSVNKEIRLDDYIINRNNTGDVVHMIYYNPRDSKGNGSKEISNVRVERDNSNTEYQFKLAYRYNQDKSPNFSKKIKFTANDTLIIDGVRYARHYYVKP